MTSAIPATLVALANLFTTAAVPGLTVSDGPLYDPPGPYCCIGWDDTNTPGVVMTSASTDYSGYNDQEAFDVQCLLSWWIDANDTATARQAAFDAYDALAATVEADLTLGDLVTSAKLGGISVTTALTPEGGTVDLRFPVSVTAFK